MALVITTIQPPTNGVRAIAQRAADNGMRFFVIGDQRSPREWECQGATYYSYEQQTQLPFATAEVVPPNTYTRKMLGYLLAAVTGCSTIRETDDDNLPYDKFFDVPPTVIRARIAKSIKSWVNIYSYFTDRYTWPRGFPLRHLHDAGRSEAPISGEDDVSGLIIFQAIADGDPDVDAVYRLTGCDVSDIHFSQNPPLRIPHGSWTPFNSQATTWPIELLPLMYLPSTCSFRMTDIWRSFIAQRLLPSFDAKLLITSATVFQERNAHDLMRDFVDEIEGYTGYERFIHTLEEIPVGGRESSVLSDLRLIYLRLVQENFFASSEIPLLEAWLTDIKELQPETYT